MRAETLADAVESEEMRETKRKVHFAAVARVRAQSALRGLEIYVLLGRHGGIVRSDLLIVHVLRNLIHILVVTIAAPQTLKLMPKSVGG